MNSFFLCFVGLLLSANLASCQKYGTQSTEADNFFKCANLDTQKEYHDDFDWNLIGKFNQQKENTLVSPISVKIAMAILYLGSGSTTKEQLQQVMGFKADEKMVAREFKAIRDCLKSPVSDEYTLDIASRLYADKIINMRGKYKTSLEYSFGTQVKSMDSLRPLETVADANQWVKETTRGNINQLLQEDDLTDVVLLLLSAIYFKGTWETPFPVKDTKNRKFYINASNIVDVPFMTQIEKFNYTESRDLDAKILKMPFKGQSIVMTILLPNSIQGLPEMKKKLTSFNLNQEMNSLKNVNVKVTLPKFKYVFESHLVPVLRELGITELFENTAHLGGIAAGAGLENKLAVSNVLQKAGIEMNEIGTTAYAATAVSLVNKFGIDDEVPEDFLADKPFLFFIEDYSTKQVLFSGTINNPTVTSGVLEEKPVDVAATINELFPVHALPQRPLHSLNPSWNQRKEPTNTRFHYFDQELMEVATQEIKGNFMISPASIKATLAMLYEGADGPCAVELQKILRLPLDHHAARDLFTKYLSSLKSNSNGVVLESANRIFLNNKYTPRQHFQQILRSNYHSEINSVDFKYPDAAAQTVNGWISDATHNLIQNFVSPSDFNYDTIMLLANALYFKGEWEQAFDSKLTRPACFHVNSENDCRYVAMMDSEEEYNYAYIDSINSHAIELPYKGDKFSMLILLPKEVGDVDLVVKDLRHVKIEDIVNKLQKSDVQLTMPKFKINFETELIDVLKKVGINELFSPAANLSGLVNELGQSPQVNQVIHKTFIEVNEKGATAAAVTGAMVVPLMGTSTEIMNINHPFLFFIRDNTTGAILFGGRVNQPDLVERPVMRTTHRPKVQANKNTNIPTGNGNQNTANQRGRNPTPEASTRPASTFQGSYEPQGNVRPAVQPSTYNPSGSNVNADFGSAFVDSQANKPKSQYSSRPKIDDQRRRQQDQTNYDTSAQSGYQADQAVRASTNQKDTANNSPAHKPGQESNYQSDNDSGIQYNSRSNFGSEEPQTFITRDQSSSPYGQRPPQYTNFDTRGKTSSISPVYRPNQETSPVTSKIPAYQTEPQRHFQKTSIPVSHQPQQETRYESRGQVGANQAVYQPEINYEQTSKPEEKTSYNVRGQSSSPVVYQPQQRESYESTRKTSIPVIYQPVQQTNYDNRVQTTASPVYHHKQETKPEDPPKAKYQSEYASKYQTSTASTYQPKQSQYDSSIQPSNYRLEEKNYRSQLDLTRSQPRNLPSNLRSINVGYYR